jgi:FMN phosphatase YigB (HAD superfamily)
MKPLLVLFDIDHTLFDTQRFFSTVAQAIMKSYPTITYTAIEQAARVAWQKDNNFVPGRFATELIAATGINADTSQIIGFFLDKNRIIDALFPDVDASLKQIVHIPDVTCGIFSRGETSYQQMKIASISEYFSKKYVYIFAEKKEMLSEIIHEHTDKTIVFIDDVRAILQEAKRIDPSVITVWIKQGDIQKSLKEAPDFLPDYAAEDITMLSSIIGYMVDTRQSS